MINVSIIVPIYNCENYIDKCINSIINQTLKNIEIILINDGSSDKSGKIADEYAKKDKRIRVIYQENSGPSASRNRGISISTGKYIGFVDSDDYIEPTMYEELYNNANKENIQVAMCSYNEKYMYNNDFKVVKSNLENNKLYDKIGIENNIISTFAKNENYGFYSLWNKIYLRTWLIDYNITMDIKRDYGEDWWFNISVFSKIDSFIYIDKQLYNYMHVNSNSLMFKYRENQFDLFLDGRLKMKNIIPNKYIDDKELNRRFVYEFSVYIINTLKQVRDRNQRKLLINKVLNNYEVIESCKNVRELGIHFKITTFLIKHKSQNIAKICYKLISIIK